MATFEKPSTAAIPRRNRSHNRGPVAIIEICRLLVGALFTFSGFVKVNDVHGFANKLEKYWFVFESQTGWPMGWLVGINLGLAEIIAVFETILGIFLLLGIARRFTATTIFLMIIFFTFLTGWAAITKSIDDCGCFGDFLKIDPWVSFLKDIVLLVLTGLLFYYRDLIRPLFRNSLAENIAAAMVVLGVIGFAFYTLNYEPLVDLRPCKVGNDMRAITTFDPNTGIAELKDYVPVGESCQGEDEMKGDVLLVFIRKMEEAATDEDAMRHLLGLTKELQGTVKVYILTSTSRDEAKLIASRFGLGNTCISIQDGTMMTTCIRSNPGYVLVQNGIIMAKWAKAAAPTSAEIKAELGR